MLKPQSDLDCVSALNNFCRVIEDAGGVETIGFKKPILKQFVCHTDLAEAYLKACDALGLAPLVDGGRSVENIEDEEADNTINAECDCGAEKTGSTHFNWCSLFGN